MTRTYPKLSHRKVGCPRTSLLGFGKGSVKAGEIIKWRYNDQDDEPYIGRVLGSVADHFQPGDTDLKGYLVVLTLSDCATFAYIRYVKPEQVRIIHEADRLSFLRWFAGPMGTAEDVMKYAEYGSLCASYIGDHTDGEGKLLPYGGEGRPGHVVKEDTNG